MEAICVAQFKAKNGRIADLIEALKMLIPPTLNEPGCLQYELCYELPHNSEPEDMWDVCLIERWRTVDDFQRHCDASYIKCFFMSLQSIMLKNIM